MQSLRQRTKLRGGCYRSPLCDLAEPPARGAPWIAGLRRHNEQSKWRRLWLRRLGAESPRCIPLGASDFRCSRLPHIFPISDFLVLRTCKGGKESHQIVDLGLGKCQRLDVLIEPRVGNAVAFVVMINNIPQGIH